jgi:pilus assembly protein CpaF
VPTVAACIDLVVHVNRTATGQRRISEIVAVPGRCEGDVIETADIFLTRDGALERADGWPPHAERYARSGWDLTVLLGRERTRRVSAVIG